MNCSRKGARAPSYARVYAEGKEGKVRDSRIWPFAARETPTNSQSSPPSRAPVLFKRFTLVLCGDKRGTRSGERKSRREWEKEREMEKRRKRTMTRCRWRHGTAAAAEHACAWKLARARARAISHESPPVYRNLYDYFQENLIRRWLIAPASLDFRQRVSSDR